MNRRLICKICGSSVKVCYQYGVTACLACGQFFRRYVNNKNKNEFKCKCHELNSETTQLEQQRKCKGCRLQRCLLFGMKKTEGYTRHDVVREIQEDKNQIVSKVVDISTQDRNEIDFFLPIIEAKKRIMHAFTDLDDIFLHVPILFEDIICSGFNIFNLLECFSPNPRPVSLEEMQCWEKDIEGVKIFSNRGFKCLLVDKMICVGVAKSMPFFNKLSLADQLVHIRHIYHAFNSFTNSYLAWELGVDTWTRKDCVMPALTNQKNTKLINDNRMNELCDKVFTKSLTPFKQTAVSKEEYALLVAIFFTLPNASGLSKEGKDLLYEESVRYVKILLRHIQNQIGVLEGARRLDECMGLINCSFETARIFRISGEYRIKKYPSVFGSSNFLKLFHEHKD